MNKNIFRVLICFLLIVSLIGIAEAKKEACDLSFVNSAIDEGLSKINENTDALKFISETGYTCVKNN
jgi:hypothetical protein